MNDIGKTVMASEHQVALLAEALGKCLVASGTVRADADLTGPHLLVFAEDLERFLKELNTRPAPAATDTGLEIDIEATAENIARSMSNYKNSGRLHGPTYEVAKAAAITALTCAKVDTRSQAVELLAAERAEKDARIKELEADRDHQSKLSNKLNRSHAALEAKLAAAERALEAIEDHAARCFALNTHSTTALAYLKDIQDEARAVLGIALLRAKEAERD